jgi:cytochrome d ubiquinol oxidase subunit I
MKVGAVFGLFATLLIAWTGDGSAYNVAQRQPMKLAAMEGLYQGKTNVALVAIGVLNPAKKTFNDSIDPFLFKIQIPSMLSLLAQKDANAFVPGISNIIDGGYQTRNGVALSFLEKQTRGRAAIRSLASYQKAMIAKDSVHAKTYKAQLKENYPQFGYGYIDKAENLIPNVPLVFYSFHIMILLGFYFIALFALVLIFFKGKRIQNTKWLLWICIWSIPLGYIAGELGWAVAEVGRQPWAIQDVLPLNAAISNISSDSVKITFFLFLILFSALLLAEIRIMLKQIKKGPEAEH